MTTKPFAGSDEHVDNRSVTLKLQVRNDAQRWLDSANGAYYVPFSGEGHCTLGYPQQCVIAIDTDKKKCELYSDRYKECRYVIVADATRKALKAELKNAVNDMGNNYWSGFVLADFDAYGNPFPAFNRWIALNPKLGDNLALIFTDANEFQLMNMAKVIDHNLEKFVQSDRRTARDQLRQYRQLVLDHIRKALPKRFKHVEYCRTLRPHAYGDKMMIQYYSVYASTKAIPDDLIDQDLRRAQSSDPLFEDLDPALESAKKQRVERERAQLKLEQERGDWIKKTDVAKGIATLSHQIGRILDDSVDEVAAIDAKQPKIADAYNTAVVRIKNKVAGINDLFPT